MSNPFGTCLFTRLTDRPTDTLQAWWDGSRQSSCTVRDLCCTADSSTDISTCEFGAAERDCRDYAYLNHIKWKQE